MTSYHVRYRLHDQTYAQSFETAFDRGLWVIGWSPYVTVLEQWEAA